MALPVLLTLIGTLTGVLGTVVAVLQLRRTPVSSHKRSLRRRGEPTTETHSPRENGSGLLSASDVTSGMAPDGREVADTGKPVLLHAPTGRLTEVWGRNGLLDALTAKLDSPDGRFQVLAGLGGVGKTTVALAMAERARSRGGHVWWISGVDAPSVADGMLAVAARLGAPRAEIEQARAGGRHPADVVWDRLEEHSGWLLVIDNADDEAALQVAGCCAADGTGWLRPTHAGCF
jgi:hypothetical protein